jgi:hypothetical protein
MMRDRVIKYERETWGIQLGLWNMSSGHILAKAAALRINLNIGGTPIVSRSHTHPSLSHLSSLKLVTFFRCSSPPFNPVYTRRVVPSVLAFSLSLHTLIGIVCFIATRKILGCFISVVNSSRRNILKEGCDSVHLLLPNTPANATECRFSQSGTVDTFARTCQHVSSTPSFKYLIRYVFYQMIYACICWIH